MLFLCIIILVLIFGGFLFGYDIGVFNGVLLYMGELD